MKSWPLGAVSRRFGVPGLDEAAEGDDEAGVMCEFCGAALARFARMHRDPSRAIPTIYLTEAVSACGTRYLATDRRWIARQVRRAPCTRFAL